MANTHQSVDSNQNKNVMREPDALFYLFFILLTSFNLIFFRSRIMDKLITVFTILFIMAASLTSDVNSLSVFIADKEAAGKHHRASRSRQKDDVIGEFVRELMGEYNDECVAMDKAGRCRKKVFGMWHSTKGK